MRHCLPRHVILALCLSAPLTALPATILGSVSRDNQPAANLPLSLACPGGNASGQTDARGTYRLTVNGSGKCQLTAEGASAEVILYNQSPTQYDFMLQGSGAAARLVRR